MRGALAFAASLITAFAACGGDNTLESQPDVDAPANIQVESEFTDGEEVPVQFTCEGDDVSPPLAWTRVPEASEYALLVTDPDAPGGTFVHWVVYGIPASEIELARGEVPETATEGATSLEDPGYGGPCPPPGDDPHHYEFTVYAIDERVAAELDPSAPAEEVLDAIRPDIIAQGTLTGTFAR